MGKYAGMLLASDYDDTLYGGSILPENRQAILRFMEEGGRFTIATGRSLRNFSIQMEREQIPMNAPLILANGANIYDYAAGEMLYAATMRGDIRANLAALSDKFPIGLEAYCNEAVYAYRPNEVTHYHLKRAGLPWQECPPEALPLPLTKVLIQHEDTALLEQVRMEILLRYATQYEAIFSSPVLLELTAKGVHKGSAVSRLARHLGIADEAVYCVGNGQNDLPMLRVAAKGFAPDNCTEEVRREPDLILLPSCTQPWMPELLRHITG